MFNPFHMVRPKVTQGTELSSCTTAGLVYTTSSLPLVSALGLL